MIDDLEIPAFLRRERKETMNLSSIIPTNNLIEVAFTQPAMRIKPRSSKRPDIETALKCIVNQIETDVIEAIANDVVEKLQEVYDGYMLMNGERSDPGILVTEWDSGMDDAVEAAIEEWQPHLSADWLGVNTIGTALHAEHGIGLFASKLGKEYYKQITYGKTPVQIMSSASIMRADVEAALEKHINPTQQEMNTMAASQNAELGGIIEKIAAHVGKDHDILMVYEDLDLISGEDEFLAKGALPRLGLDEEDMNALQSERMVHGDQTPDVLQEMLNEALKGEKKPKAKKTKGLEAPELNEPTNSKVVIEPKPAKKPKKAKVNADEEEGNIDPVVLEVLKESGYGDADLSKGVGTSRATLNNYVNGKTAFAPSAEQYQFLRDAVVSKINRLHEALAALDDKDEAEVVF